MELKCKLSDLTKGLNAEQIEKCAKTLINKPVVIDEEVIGTVTDVKYETDEVTILLFRNGNVECLIGENDDIVELCGLDWHRPNYMEDYCFEVGM
jgi:hypothetical protein